MMIILIRGWAGCGKTSLATQLYQNLPNSRLFPVPCSASSSKKHYVLYSACADDIRVYLTHRQASFAIVDDCGTLSENLEPFISIGSLLNHSVYQDIPFSVFDVLYHLKYPSPISRQIGMRMLEEHLHRSSYKSGDLDVSSVSLLEHSSLPFFNYGYCL